jgi:uncharacterized protein (TIGR00255 family)
MAIRSMTAFAQVKGQAAPDAQAAFTLSLKSVNHRFLDLHLRLPGDTDALEMKLRKLLKEKIARGHVEVSLQWERGGTAAFAINREFIGGYIQAFRAAAQEFGVSAQPDLNAILRLPGALGAAAESLDGNFEAAVLSAATDAVQNLNTMREEEGRGLDQELRERMTRVSAATAQMEKVRAGVSRAYLEKIQTRIQELMGGQVDRERALQEAALLADRSDIEEELVRMRTHVKHFLGLLDSPGEVGKKLDFLLQEMNREANTLLSKTAGLAGDGLKITELGLAMKTEIEKSREQVQNIE